MPARSDIGAKRPLLSDLKILPAQSEVKSDRAAVLQRFGKLFAAP
jgi:iron(III) transport system substrate-binding protein